MTNPSDTERHVISQGYPLYAVVDPADDEAFVAAIVGWSIVGDNVVPIMVAEDGSAAVAVDDPVMVDPALGHVAAEVRRRKGIANDPKSSQTAARRSPAARYVRGATALCGLVNAHEAHLWTPDEHDFAIRCTGAPA